MASIVEILVNIKDNASSFFADLADRMSGASAAGSGLSSVLTEITTILGLGALGGAVAASVEVWAEWQQSVVELNAALSLSGQYSEAASAQIQGMAEYIQNVTTVSKQSALGVSEMAAAFTKLQPTELAELQKAAVGFQTVFGGGMEHAATLFSRSLEGSGIVLRRYGVVIDAMMTEQERFQAIMSRFGPMFQIAEEGANTLTGRFEQMKNQFQDLERTIGDLLSRILGIQGGLEGTKSLIESANEWIKAHGDVLVAYGTRFVTVVKMLIELIPALFQVVLDKTVPLFKTVHGWVDTLETLFARISNRILNDPVFGGGPHIEVTVDTTPAEKHIIELENRWKDLVKLLLTPVETPKLKDPLGTVTTGLGSTIPEEGGPAPKSHIAEVENLTGAQKLLDEQLRDGTKTYAEYLAKATELKNAMALEEAMIRDHIMPQLKEGSASYTAASHAVDQLIAAQKRLGAEAPPELEKLLAKQRELEEQNKKHMISSAEYSKQTKENEAALAAWRVQLEKVLKTLDLTDKEIAAILKHMTSIDAAGHKSATSIGSVFDTIMRGMSKGKDAEENAVNSVQAYGQAFEKDVTKGIEAALFAHQHFADAVKKAVGTAAATEAKNAVAHAVFELAAGFASSAIGDAGGATKHFQAASTYGIAAAEFGALGGALGGFSGGGGGGGAGSSAKSQANEVAGKLGSGTIIIEGGLLDMSNPQQADAFAKAIKDLTGRDVIVLAG